MKGERKGRLKASGNVGALESMFHTASSRILDIMIREGRSIAVQELVEASGISERGIKRVLPTLIEAGVVIEEGRSGHRKLYVLKKNVSTDLLQKFAREVEKR